MMNRFFCLAAALLVCASAQALGALGQDGASGGAQTEEQVYTPREVDQRARLTHNPAPEVTEEARQHSYRGTVQVRAVLGADGQVRSVMSLTKAPYGMEEACVKAARGIEFEPALKAGRTVSQYVIVIYHITIF